MSHKQANLYKPADLDYLRAELRRLSAQRVHTAKADFWRIIRWHLRDRRKEA